MGDLNVLKTINILKTIDDSTLEQISRLATVETYNKDDYLYKEGETAKKLFSIIEGKVCIEIQKNSSTTCRVEDLSSGNTTGISSLVDEEDNKHLFSARVLMPTKVFTWQAEDLEKLFRQNPTIGWIFMRRVARILKRRLSIKNIQLADIFTK
jgi:CRP/FNR family transcriptional regulator, cyclic AMP receptor protein